MMTLDRVRAHVAAACDGWAQAQSPDAWRWRTETSASDYALSIHALKLGTAAEQALIEALQEGELQDLVERVSIENGYLNLQFKDSFWAEAVIFWLNDPQRFVLDCGLPADLAAETIHWRYRILKAMHQAAQIAQMDHWISPELLKGSPSSADIQRIKALLSLGGMLHQRRELSQKRQQMMLNLEEQIAELWQSPILLPADPSGSAWRQAYLRLSLAAADAIGQPQLQSMETALRMQYA